MHQLPSIDCYQKKYGLANQKGHFSLGATLTDTLDDLITDHRIDPQLAMKILANFDRAIADVLQEKVKARLTFKVRNTSWMRRLHGWRDSFRTSKADTRHLFAPTHYRARSIRTASATRYGLSSSRTSPSKWRTADRLWLRIGLRS